MKIPYQIADEAAARIIKKIHKQFQHNRLALFDEMNILQTRKHVKKLYRNVERIVIKEFTEILHFIEEEYYDIALDMGYDGDIRDLDESFIEEFFEEYNPVTKYVFKNEMGRKESRLFESLVADAKDKIHNYATAEKLLKKQATTLSLPTHRVLFMLHQVQFLVMHLLLTTKATFHQLVKMQATPVLKKLKQFTILLTLQMILSH